MITSTYQWKSFTFYETIMVNLYHTEEVYIAYMLQACKTITMYIQWYDYERFFADQRTRDACLMQLQHLWECAYWLSKNHKKIILTDQKRIIWLRHFISHEYTGITYERLRDIVMNKIPTIITELESLQK